MIDFLVVTPDGVTYQDNIEKVSIPTEAGEIMVLEGHESLTSVLGSGEMVVYKDNYTVSLALTGGVLEVNKDGKVIVLADNAERAEKIDVERAIKAKARAEELLAGAVAIDDLEFARIQAILERESTRISVGRSYRG